jgi:hypothetical protein
VIRRNCSAPGGRRWCSHGSGGWSLASSSPPSRLWLVAAMVIGFVVAPNPWKMTPHEFHVDCQPWITLNYAAIFAGAWLRLALSRTSWARRTCSEVSPV